MAVDLCSSDDLSVLSLPGLYKGHGGPLMFHYVRRSRNKNMQATSNGRPAEASGEASTPAPSLLALDY